MSQTHDPNYEIERAANEVPPETLHATEKLISSFDGRRSRRWLLKAAAATGGVATLGSTVALTALPAHAEATQGSSADKEIFSIAATAEQLAVTFYAEGIAKASGMGITGDNLTYLKAALVEEQIHRDFLVAQGGVPLTDTFSFPYGASTFTDMYHFVQTLGDLELLFTSAYLLSVKGWAAMGKPTLAQIGAQLACVEGEHRALGRSIAYEPANNVAFEPVFFTALSQIVPTVKREGYLSPVAGNSYTYHAVSTDYPAIIDRTPNHPYQVNLPANA